MKCSQFEKQIYLHDEPTSRQRQEIDAHVSTCGHCMQTLNAVRQMRKLVALHQSETPSSRNHTAMTQRIMDAVGDMQEENRSLFERMTRYLPQAQIPGQVRYHMAVLSFVLMATFLIEYSNGIGQPKIVRPYQVADPKTELNLASFHTLFLETRPKNRKASVEISDCVARCLKVSTHDCKECGDKFAKPGSIRYEKN